MPQQRWRRQLQGDNEWNPLPTGSGDFYNPEPTPLPRSSPSPTSTPFPTATPRSTPGGDNSNAGLVNRTLFDNQANADWWSTERPLEPVSGSAGGRLTGIGAGAQGVHSYGEPTVQVPTSDARYTFDFDSAPSLFGNPNEFWRQGVMAQGAASPPPSANDGGGIWSGDDTIGAFGGDLTLGSDLFASLDSMQFGEDYPAVSVPEQPLLAENAIPVEPDVIPQDYEWTTSPGDRRFLPEPEATPDSATGGDSNAGRISTGGTSLSGFGGDTSLGSYLNTPLAMMNFGGGYPQGGGRRGDGLMTGVVTAGGQVDSWGNQIDDVGGRWVDRPDGSGADWVESATANPRGQGSGRNDGTGTTTIPIPTAQGGGAPTGMTIVGTDTRTGAPIYRDSNGNLFVNPGTGTRVSPGVASAIGRDYESAYGQSELSRDSAFTMMMASMSGQMNPKMQTGTGDAGKTLFNMGRSNQDRPNITLEGGQIVRQPGGRTLGRGGLSQVGGLG